MLYPSNPKWQSTPGDRNCNIPQWIFNSDELCNCKETQQTLPRIHGIVWCYCCIYWILESNKSDLFRWVPFTHVYVTSQSLGRHWSICLQDIVSFLSDFANAQMQIGILDNVPIVVAFQYLLPGIIPEDQFAMGMYVVYGTMGNSLTSWSS